MNAQTLKKSATNGARIEYKKHVTGARDVGWYRVSVTGRETYLGRSVSDVAERARCADSESTAENFCACGRRVSDCDGSRLNCVNFQFVI